MKKFVALFTLATLSVQANQNTWDYPLFAFDRYKIIESYDGSHYEFQSSLRKDQDVLDEFKTSGILSYLLFENDKIVIDESKYYDVVGDGPLPSHSMGKSLVGYITGHAICNGDISSTSEKLDWDLLENTLYHNQPLINILNMVSGDQKYIGMYHYQQSDNFLKYSNINSNLYSLEYLMGLEKELARKGKQVYNYSALTTNIILNYVLHKSGYDILNKVFTTHVKVKKPVYFAMTREDGSEYNEKHNGQSMRYSFYADRYDYLRIAKTIMDDWNSDTCIGDYLRTIYDLRIDKGDGYKNVKTAVHSYAKSYGGQFHFDVDGLSQTIIGLDGFAGQNILIDVDNEKIIVINSKYADYDWEEIVYEKYVH